MRLHACLIIERGAPFEAGTRIELLTGECCLGRSSRTNQADISFSSLLVSRRHCCLAYQDNDLMLSDLGSKHGTMLNGKAILPYEKHILRNGDTIGLAMGIVLVRIADASENEETMDLSQTQAMSLRKHTSVVLGRDKWECRIDGQPLILTEKEWYFFKLLYDHVNSVVTYDEIRTAVWPERRFDANQVPDAGLDEINMLMYRVRKKMGKRALMLKTVRARGYMLEIG